MIRGIHYFSAEVKPKLMSSQGAALIHWFILLLKKYLKEFKGMKNIFKTFTAKLLNLNFYPLEIVSLWRDPQI